MNGESGRPRVGAFAGEPVLPMPAFTPSTSGWQPPPRLERGRPDYGIDAPAALLRVAGFALATGLGAIVAARPAARVGRGAGLASGLLGLASLGATLVAASGLAYAKRGKRAHRDRVLDVVAWTGSERVLDIGTGGGLLMIGAAKRLGTGKAVGIDVWRQSDLTSNTRETTMRNAYFEDVVAKVDVRFEDARKLKTCVRNSFDVVFATRVLGSIADPADREAACNEIARVLKPGGTAIVSDVRGVGSIRRALAADGLAIASDTFTILETFAYLRTIVAVKPGAPA